MKEILVVGHKNPDTDSLCAVYAYSNFKNLIDRDNKYTPIRCGSVNEQSRYVFEKLKVPLPILYKDIFPKINDVMTKEVISVKTDDPLYDALSLLRNKRVRIVPIVDNENSFKGFISIFEISSYIIPEDLLKTPEYIIRFDCFEKILKGKFLKRGNLEELKCIISAGAMPFEDFVKFMNSKKEKSILLVVGNRKDIIRYAIDNNFDCIIVSGVPQGNELSFDLKNFKGIFFITPLETYDVLRLLIYLAPCKYIANRNIKTVMQDTYLKEARNSILASENRALPIVDNEGKLKGIVTRSDILRYNPKKVILVDHNEFTQAIDGIETAEIVEIIDHHRIGNIKTKNPIHILAKPVGSSCTIVYEMYKSYNIPLDRDTSLILLSGILSDTIMLKSPTTTSEDISAVEEISIMTKVDYKKWGEEMFSKTAVLNKRNIKELILSDFKIYDEDRIKIGIGQIEVVNFSEANAIKDTILENLCVIRDEKSLNWAMLMVTNIVTGSSILYTTDFPEGEQFMVYKKVSNNEYYLENTISRKKQLLPEILNILEQLYMV